MRRSKWNSPPSLLEVRDEAELDRFLGSIFKKAAKAVGGIVSSPIGKALGGVLKGVAQKALPLAGTAAGAFFGGPLGAQIGGEWAPAAGKAVGLELQELNQEDREYEGAKQHEGCRRGDQERCKRATCSQSSRRSAEGRGFRGPAACAGFASTGAGRIEYASRPRADPGDGFVRAATS